jgi:fatty-acyl-CoA synthase
VDGEGVATVADLVEALGHEDRGFTFLVPRAERRLSFADLRERARAAARRLRGAGLAPGDRALLILPRDEEFVQVFFGAMLAGVVPVPLYPPFAGQRLDAYADRIRGVMRVSEAAAVVTSPAIAARLAPISVPSFSFEDLEATSPASDLPADPAGDIAFLQFTSGSTADPKGVVITHDAVVANARGISEYLEIDGDHDRAVSWLPMYHDMGLVGMVIAPLLQETASWFMSPLTFARRPQDWCALMSRVGGTVTYSPNFGYDIVAERVSDEDVAGWDLSSWRVAGCGAEPIRADALRRFADRLAPAGFSPAALVPSYGLAESTMVVTATPPGRGMRTLEAGPDGIEPVSCGPALPGHEVTVVGEDGAPLPEGREGSIVVRGPSAATGYYRDPERSAETFRDGGVVTGDLGFLDGGELFVTGRLKDLLVLRGRNHHPQDLEWCAAELEDVRVAGVVAFSCPGGDGSEEAVIVAETDRHRGHGELADAIRKRVFEQLGIRAGDVLVVELGTVPKTTSGKLRRSELRSRYLAGALEPAAAR